MMSTTAQQIFDIAMGLMDELDGTGSPNTSDNNDYKNRTLYILNALRGECYPYSDTYKSVESGKRPVSTYITALTDNVDIDDVIAQSIMPYGLSAQLLIDENPATASFMQQRYEELLLRYGKGIPSEFSEIENPYGGIEHGEFGAW